MNSGAIFVFTIELLISVSEQRPRARGDTGFIILNLNDTLLPDPKDIKIDIDYSSQSEKRKKVSNDYLEINTDNRPKESKVHSKFPLIFLNDSLLPDPKDIKIDIDITTRNPIHFKRVSDRKCNEYKTMTSDLKIFNRGRTGRNLAIIGGQNANIQDYPHMGALGWKLREEDSWKFLCGGSLISLNFILTAAHCTSISSRHIIYEKTKPDIVRLGVTNILNPSKYDFKLERIIKHPLYQAPTTYYDIALIKLDQTVMINKRVRPACIWSSHDLGEIEEVTLAGWGSIDKDSKEPNPLLQSATVQIIEKEVCKPLLNVNRNFHILREHQICAGNLTGGVDSCEGDSGGPLQIKQDVHTFVIAVISFGHRCGLVRTPAVYTKVFTFIDWIELVVWGDELHEFF